MELKETVIIEKHFTHYGADTVQMTAESKLK
jgi:hypothetical protein